MNHEQGEGLDEQSIDNTTVRFLALGIALLFGRVFTFGSTDRGWIVVSVAIGASPFGSAVADG
ncbi:MAG TPA: hypothetical protein PKI41_04055 [Candidatus Competibacteraceae bacterium]|nr:hypothetical protein [Candidatus Competibacteraceae bacterium]HQA24593.1 hypothetical protein [Candidatus Competibacteraceae bacterium]HQD55637.1 hypothetical protein [Candidatus Competibacteraceae bacterium]